MSRNLILIGLIFLSASAYADANDGEYRGIKLGEKLTTPRGAVGKDHVIGAKIYVVAPSRQPHHIDSMSIYASPKSSVIGSIFGQSPHRRVHPHPVYRQTLPRIECKTSYVKNLSRD